jgi:hypothetical protein
MPEFWSFLEKHCKQHTPDQSTIQKHYLPICYEETLENIKGNIGDAVIWVAADEKNSVGCFIKNLVAGKLVTSVPSNPRLICSEVLHHIDHSTVARFVNDGLGVSWPTEAHKEKVPILYSYAMVY